MDLDEYLIGVVAASIPFDYHDEALKAQAVIARTNIINILGSRKSIDDYQLNQPYINPYTLKKTARSPVADNDRAHQSGCAVDFR